VKNGVVMEYKKRYESAEMCGWKYRLLKRMCTGNAIQRNLFYWYINKFEGGQFYSRTLRKIYKELYDIDAGVGSYGCFTTNFRPHVKIGNYCSIAPGVQRLVGNHPLTDVSTHPIFHKKEFGLCPQTRYTENTLIIGNDVWIGVNAILLSSVHAIGNGAVIGAGAVVTKDIPPYAVVAGVPAKIIRFRFDQEMIGELEKTKWFELKPDELRKYSSYAADVSLFVKKINELA